MKYLWLLVSLMAVNFLARATPALAIDPLDYFLPPDAPPVHISNGEVFHSIPQGGNSFIIQKSLDAAYYERFSFDGGFIYHHEDTTWATETGNVECFSGGEAYFNLYDGSFGSGGNVCAAYNTLKPKSGMKWVPRQMQLGSCFASIATVVGFSKSTKQCCEAPFSGPGGGHTMCLKYQGCLEFPNGVFSDDGIALEVTGGAGSGETYYYDKNVGWVGFSRAGGASCAYVTDPLPHDPSLTNCLKVQCRAPETVALQDNLICTDFSLTKSSTTQTATEPGVLGTNTQTETGDLTLEKEALPNFSVMEQNLFLALNQLLPENLRRGLVIDQTPLKTKVKHYVVDAVNPVAPEQVPETAVTFPNWWTKILGESKIACGFFNTCTPPASMAIQVAALSSGTAPSYQVGCPMGNKAKDEPVSELQTISSPFSAIASPIISTIKKWLEDLWRWVTQTQTTINLVNKSRGYLPGGETAVEQSKFYNGSIPAGLSPQDSGAAVAGQATFKNTGGLQQGPGSDKLHYQEEIVRQRYCLQLCGNLPSGFGVSSADGLCDSCQF